MPFLNNINIKGLYINNNSKEALLSIKRYILENI